DRHGAVVEPGSRGRTTSVGQDDEGCGHNQHDAAQELLHLDIESHGVREKHHDDIWKKDAILEVLNPHRAPGEELNVGSLNDVHVRKLVCQDGIEAVML